MSDYVVYGLSLADGPIRYIGFTVEGPQRRLNVHRCNANGGVKTALYDWMRKYATFRGREFTVTVLEDVGVYDLALLQQREIYWIDKMNTLLSRGLGGLNMTEGGTGGWPKGRPKSDAWREANASYWSSEEVRQAHGEKVRERIANSDERARGAHTRWHTNRGKTKDGCVYCDQLNQNAA